MPKNMSDADITAMFDDIGRAKENLARGIVEEQKRKAEEAKRHRPFGGGPVYDDDVDLDAMEREIDAQLEAARRGMPAWDEDVPDLGLEIDLSPKPRRMEPPAQTIPEQKKEIMTPKHPEPEEIPDLIVNLDTPPMQKEIPDLVVDLDAPPTQEKNSEQPLVQLTDTVFDVQDAKTPVEQIQKETVEELPEIDCALDLTPEIDLVLDLDTPVSKKGIPEEPVIEIPSEPAVKIQPENPHKEETFQQEPREEPKQESISEPITEKKPEEPVLEVIAVGESEMAGCLDVYLYLFASRPNRFSYAFETATNYGEKRFCAESIGCDSWKDAAFIAANALLKELNETEAKSIVIHTKPEIADLLCRNASYGIVDGYSEPCEGFVADVRALAAKKSLRINSYIPNQDIWRSVMYMAKASSVRE